MNPAGKVLDQDATESVQCRLPLLGRRVISFRPSSARFHLKGLTDQGSDETKPQESVAAEVTRLNPNSECGLRSAELGKSLVTPMTPSHFSIAVHTGRADRKVQWGAVQM